MAKIIENLFSRIYELPLSRDYVKHWGLVEAVREIFQNAIDSESPFEYTIGANYISITSKFSKLEPKTLLLGSTSKSDNPDAIGSFGEGYKIALLVLTRENRSVLIHNGELLWTPEFTMSHQFGEEILCIRESKRSEGRGKGLTFVINDLSQSEIQQITATNMHMWKSVGEVIDTSRGQIMIDHPGKLFVNGLFVCDTELKFGYNIKPEYLKLERDRQTVSSFDLKWTAKDMWFETGRYDEIAKMISDDYPDMEHANYGTPAMVKEACYQIFIEQHPGSVAASSQSELKELVAKGMERVVYISGSYYSVVTSAKSYAENVTIKLHTPQEILADWFRENRSHMRREAIVAFKELHTKSKTWKA